MSFSGMMLPSRRILTIYISYVINQALQYLRDSFPSSKENESLLAQIRLCNEIVQEIAEHTNEPEFEDNIILEKGEVLTSLYEKMNSARSINTIKAVHPETSIIENALFTGSKRRQGARAFQVIENAKTNLSYGDIVILLDKRELFRKQEKIDLSFIEFEILHLLMRSPGRVFSKEQIYDIIWNEPYSGDYNVVMRHICNIREKIEDDPG